MALFAGLRAGLGRLTAGSGSAGRCSFQRALLAPKGKRVAQRSAAGNRGIWRPNLSNVTNKPLKTYGGSYRLTVLVPHRNEHAAQARRNGQETGKPQACYRSACIRPAVARHRNLPAVGLNAKIRNAGLAARGAYGGAVWRVLR